jgi:hypothetical protein
MPDVRIEQALYRREGRETPRLVARSADFLDDWLPDAEELIRGFGDPPGASFGSAIYAHPLGTRHVAVVQVAERALPDAGQKAVVDYHLLVLAQSAYEKFYGDPFVLARLLPPPWDAPDPLPPRRLPAEPLPARTVHEVQQILKRSKAAALREDVEPTSEACQDHSVKNALGPALLGSVQILVDGGRVVFERPASDPDLMQGLWTLLPTSTRCHLWPASFAFSNTLGFDAFVMPRVRAEDLQEYMHYTREEQAAEYPEGRYERRLQAAAETGDQAELDALFARRSSKETIRLGVTILTILSVLVLGLKFFDQGPAPRPIAPEKTRQQIAVVVSLVGTPSALHNLTVLPVARETWNRMETGKALK